MSYWNPIVGDAIAGNGDYTPLIALQPIVPLWDLDNRSFFEVLIRLKDPRGHVFPAGAFIDAIYPDERLMLALDRWVVDQVAALIEKTDYQFAVNISGWSAQSASFPQAIANTLTNAGAPVKRLSIEISERRLIGYSEKLAYEKLGQNHPLWLDDFGGIQSRGGFGYTLYSWVSGIKIDMVFARHLLDSNQVGINARAGVKAIMQMCSSQGRSCIIEGIEKDEQIDYLRGVAPVGMGLFLQGWAIGMPDLVE